MGVVDVPNGLPLLSENIATITLEEAIEQSSYESDFYLLKLDCECGEWDILPNISKQLSQKVRFVLGEWHTQDYRRILEEMKKTFPHLYPSTHAAHKGIDCGNFFALPYSEDYKHLVADHFSLLAANQYIERS